MSRSDTGSSREVVETYERHPLGLGKLLRKSCNVYEHRILAALAERGFGDLSMAHFRLISTVSMGETMPTRIAESIGIAKQTANSGLRSAERLGYLTREPDTTNGRQRIVQLTERGEKAMAIARGVALSLEAEYAKRLGVDELASLRESLRLISEELA